MKMTNGEEKIVLKNILVGEVWIAGGQSNMDYTLMNTRNGFEEIPIADYPEIRYYQVPKIPYENSSENNGELSIQQSSWERCTPETAKNFSAVAYHFAKDIFKALNVPIGIINCSWGGTSASCWMSEKYLLSDEKLRVYMDEYIEQITKQSHETYENERIRYDASVSEHATKMAKIQFNPEKVEEYFADQSAGPYPWPPPMGPKCPLRPAGLYHTMLKKIVPFAVRGVIFYQGESDDSKPYLYERLFTKMIENWREDWKNPQLPFLFVQLAAFGQENPEGEEWAIIREQQLLASKSIENTGMAVAIDFGDKNNIHPIDKKPVGERLAFLARGRVYGQVVEYSGPAYREMKIKGNKIILYFDQIGQGLVSKGDRLKGFKICGKDSRFFNAEAEIYEDTVIVSSDEVIQPIAVRYGWSNYEEVNLYNIDGFPATPFRTEKL